MQKQFILFNLDDTLVYCNKYFNQAIDQFAEQMCRWFKPVTVEQVKEKQLEIDLASVDQHGLTSERFPESFVETYLYYCKKLGKERSMEEMDLLRSLGRSVFGIKVEKMPDMDKTLEQLKGQGHELFLHTGGDEPNQRRKIAQLELMEYFDNRVFISSHKNEIALEKIIRDMNFDRKRTWMVGNSLRTDVVPGLKSGINVIFIPAELEWKYNVVDLNETEIRPQGVFVQLNSLHEVPHVINQYALKNSGGVQSI